MEDPIIPTPAPAPAPAAPTPAPAPAAPATEVFAPTTAKPGSAKESVFKSIRTKVGVEGAEPAATPAAAPAAKPAADSKAATPATAPDDAPPADLPPEKKTSPWKIVKEKEAKLKEMETRVADLEKMRLTPERQKQIEGIEARAKLLEEEIRFVDFTKSQEYLDNYEKPYIDSWQRARLDLSELTVQGPEGERPINDQDILDLVNMPLQQARAAAVEKFGDFADDVMQHRKEIKQLSQKSNDAILDARTKGAERDKLRREEFQQKSAAMDSEITTGWTKANEKVLTHEKYGTYFKPVEGDQEGNQRLAKGFELADRAFSENPRNPNLNAEQRAAIIDRHAAVRNRCAAFGRLVFQQGQSKTRIAELEAQLATYKGATPATGGSAAPAAPAGEKKGLAGLRERLQGYAK